MLLSTYILIGQLPDNHIDKLHKLEWRLILVCAMVVSKWVGSLFLGSGDVKENPFFCSSSSGINTPFFTSIVVWRY